MNDMLKDELYHKWTDAMKANYNREYYQKHKDWWKTKYADFTGGVKRAAANAKSAAKNELRRTEDRVWDARQALKGETPQSLWKSGARDIQKKLEPHAKKAKTLWDDGANDIRTKLKPHAKKAKALWDDGAKDIRDKADPYLKEGKKKAKSAKNLWDDGAKDVKSKAGKAAASAREGAKKLSSQLQKNGKQLMKDIKKNKKNVIAAGKGALAAAEHSMPGVAFLSGVAKGTVEGLKIVKAANKK